MLPESKNCFPKLLSLDQCKWIDLSRAHYGHRLGTPFRDALSAVRISIEAGKLTLPFSAVNILEFQNDPDHDRRERLARFMVDLSCNRTILPFMTVRLLEIRNAVFSLFERPVPGYVRSSIVREGLDNAWGIRIRILGLPKTVEAMVFQACDSPKASISHLLRHADQRGSVDKFQTEENSTLGIIEDVRKRSADHGITWGQRLFAELREYFLRGSVGRDVAAALEEINIGSSAFWDRITSPDEFVEFFARIPDLDVRLTLTLSRDQDLVRRIRRNDARDLHWLSVALPYSNLVVSENHWGHMIRSRGLDTKYGTTIITDARELPARLTEMGCL
jgi:hypothetical protein